MKLHAVIVSYKRLPLLRQCVESFVATVSVPYSLIVVDNGSPPGVVTWIEGAKRRLGFDALYLTVNRYPGYATNRGWSLAPDDASLLMRSDNDSIWLPGWCDEMLEAFKDPRVGQYGPIGEGDGPWTQMPTWPVGGNSIIRRELYDAGLRYDETPWPEVGRNPQEDHKLTLDVWEMGYERRFGTRPGLVFAGMRDAEYDAEVAAARRR